MPNGNKALAAFFLLTLACSAPLQAQELRFIDGDTLQLDGITYRLSGIDAPEILQQCEMRGERWTCGKQAKTNLSRIVARRPVYCEATGNDRYGRTLATCYAQSKNGNSTNLNQRMVQRGWAVNYREQKNYTDEQAEADKAKLGVWRGWFEWPWEWRARHK